jgi:hypothetical protein
MNNYGRSESSLTLPHTPGLGGDLGSRFWGRHRPHQPRAWKNHGLVEETAETLVLRQVFYFNLFHVVAKGGCVKTKTDRFKSNGQFES